MKLRMGGLVSWALAAMLLAAGPLAGQQMFPAWTEGQGVSAYLIAPTAGVSELPKGWTKDTSDTHINCMLAYENLAPADDAAPLVTVSYELPKADYDVALCCLGKGKARLKSSQKWVEVTNVHKDGDKSSSYNWTRLGTVKGATKIEVEVAPVGDQNFRYAGLVAEGSVLPVNPVAKVVEKLRQGEPITICLVGDSVTEDAKGFRGGSSKFETGNPGLMKKYLQDEFKNEVSYISHREPPGWPDDAGLVAVKGADGKESFNDCDRTKIKMVTVNGKEYRDGRVEYDAAKKIRLVNMGKGGAASPDAWRRCAETFTDSGDWRKNAKGGWDDTSAGGKVPPILRNGLAHYQPDLVTINFGTNDANGSHVGWTAAEYLFHMKVVATMAQKNFGAAVIVTTPHLWTAGAHQHPHTQPEFADAIRAYAKQSGLALADIYNEYPPGEYDGIHPGDAGHKHIADAIMKALLGKPSEPQRKATVTAAQLKDNSDGTVTDTVHNLIWTKDANLAGKVLNQADAEAFVATLNKDKKFGHDDWRLPTRDELLGLVDPNSRPALPAGHPFTNVQRGYLSTTLTQNINNIVDFSFGDAYFPNKKDPAGAVWTVCGGKK